MDAITSNIPAVPAATAIRLASKGTSTWPMRLPVIRSDRAVPRASTGARSTMPESVVVEAIPSPRPTVLIARNIKGSDGTASSAKAAAPSEMLTSVSLWRPSPAISRE